MMKRRSLLKVMAAIPASATLACGSNAGPQAQASGIAPGTPAQPANCEPGDVSRYDVIWTTPSHNSLGSMPLGDGSTGLNVWVEEDGDLLFLMGRSDTSDHHKVGRIRVKFAPNPFGRGQPFRQHLDLHNGQILIDAGPVSLRLWVDAFRTDPSRTVIRLEGTTRTPVNVQAEFELWRKIETVSRPEPHAGDVVLSDGTDRIVWWQAREHPAFTGMLTIGGVLKGAELRRIGPRTVATRQAIGQIDLAAYLHAEGYQTPTEWLHAAEQESAHAEAVPQAEAWSTHANWWHEFWQRSWIRPEGFGSAEMIAQRYAIQRFIFACSSRGTFPPLYNGSLFKMDVPASAHLFLPPKTAHDPDWRAWGPQYMGQNTRHQYWPLLTSGDFDLIQPLARLLRGQLKGARVLVWETMGHEGALHTEISYADLRTWSKADLAPLPAARCRIRPAEAPDRKYWHLQYHWLSGLEWTCILLEEYSHTLDRRFLSEVVLPCAEQFVTFYDQHYPRRDASGKMQICPAGAVETYTKARSSYHNFPQQEDVLNPTTEVSALRYLLGRLLELSDSEIGTANRSAWSRLFAELPDVPLKRARGRWLLAPGERYSPGLLCEVAEMYAVWPFRQTACWRPNALLPIARQSFYTRRMSLDGSGDEQNWETGGWLPTATYAAILGLAKEAARLLEINFADKLPLFGGGGWTADYFERPGRMRFPGFWEPHCDEPPDQDHGGNAMYALQSMLLQWDGRKIFLLPAWPENWDVDFKLHAPFGTTVECQYKLGKARALKVTPAERAKDVVDFSTMAERVRTLVSVAASDRNYLFDLPPMQDGMAVPDDIAFRPTTGPWLEKFGESIFNVRGGPFEADAWGGSVFRDNLVYLHVLNWPAEGLAFPPLHRTVISATALTGGTTACEQQHGSWMIRTSEKDPIDTIVRLELDGPIEPLAMLQPYEGSLTTGCSAAASSIEQAACAASRAVDANPATFWKPEPAQQPAWLEIDLARPQKFERAEIHLALPTLKTNQRRDFKLEIKDQDRWKLLLQSQIFGQFWSQQFATVTASAIRLTFPKGLADAGVRKFDLFASCNPSVA